MKRFFLASSFVLATALTAHAGPKSDAAYIASQTVTAEIMDGVFVAMRPVLVSSIENDFRAQGINLPDPGRFMDVFLEVWSGAFLEAMQNQSAEIYLNRFDAQELADIAAFMRSPSGQAFTQATPDLMLAGAQAGQRAGAEAGQNVWPELSRRIEAEGLIEDRTLLRRLQEAFE